MWDYYVDYTSSYWVVVASSGHPSTKHSRTFGALCLVFLLTPLEVADGHDEWRTFIGEHSIWQSNIWCSVDKLDFHFNDCARIASLFFLNILINNHLNRLCHIWKYLNRLLYRIWILNDYYYFQNDCNFLIYENTNF